MSLLFCFFSVQLIAAMEFRPGVFFAERPKTTLLPKSMTANVIQPRDTRTPPNATCRQISARESGSLDLGVRYLTSFFCLLFSKS